MLTQTLLPRLAAKSRGLSPLPGPQLWFESLSKAPGLPAASPRLRREAPLLPTRVSRRLPRRSRRAPPPEEFGLSAERSLLTQ